MTAATPSKRAVQKMSMKEIWPLVWTLASACLTTETGSERPTSSVAWRCHSARSELDQCSETSCGRA